MEILENGFPIEEFLARPLVAHLATIGADGPCESPLWYSWEDEAMWFIAGPIIGASGWA
jgi:nitroimidazol reductase NimA-like FMN-containing flavoprotein (pyridoxamine 5'-phosphate oxidase superfamily)